MNFGGRNPIKLKISILDLVRFSVCGFGACDFGDIGTQQKNARRNDDHRYADEQKGVVVIPR